jgi:hypothetical protein
MGETIEEGLMTEREFYRVTVTVEVPQREEAVRLARALDLILARAHVVAEARVEHVTEIESQGTS